MNKGETQTNEPNDKEIDDYVQVFTSERWHRKIICIKRRRNRTRIKDGVDASMRRLVMEYIRKNKERLVTAASYSKTKKINPKKKWGKTTVRVFQATN